MLDITRRMKLLARKLASFYAGEPEVEKQLSTRRLRRGWRFSKYFNRATMSLLAFLAAMGALLWLAHAASGGGEAYRWIKYAVALAAIASLFAVAYISFARAEELSKLSAEELEKSKSLQRQLYLEKERLAVTLRSIGDGILAVDRDGKTTLVSYMAEYLTGWKEADALGKPASEIMHLVDERTRRRLADPFQEVLSGGNGADSSGRDIILIANGGKEQSVFYTVAPIIAADGSAIGAVMGFRDITIDRRFQTSQAITRKAIASSANPIVMANLRGEVLQVNPAFTRLWGHEENQTRGRQMSDFVKTGRSGVDMLQGEHTATRKDGSEFYVDMIGSLVRDDDNNPVCLMFFFVDLTERKRAEAAINEERRRQKAILDNIPAMAWLKDTGGIFMTVNEPLAKFTGRPAGDITGRTGIDVLPPEMAARDQQDESDLGAGRRIDIEELVTAPDGTPRWFHTMKTPIFGENGAVIGTSGISLDITRKKEMEEMFRVYAEELSALAHASNQITGIVDIAGLQSAICENARRIGEPKMVWLGLTDEKSKDVLPVAWSGLPDEYINAISVKWDGSPEGCGPTGTAVKTSKAVVCADITKDASFAAWQEKALACGIRSALSAPLAGEHGVLGALIVYSDKPEFFSEERVELYQVFANQAAITLENARLVRSLESKITERTRQLEVQKAAAEKANQAKSSFLAHMSHELRTPLNAIIVCSGVLWENMFGPMNEKQHEYVGYIRSSGKHLLSLINDILDLSKVEAQKMKFTPAPVKLDELLEYSMRMFMEQAQQSNIRLKLDIAPAARRAIDADERKLKQIIFNLMSNALKFTNPGGQVRLAAEMASGGAADDGYGKCFSETAAGTGADCARIIVEDTGIGIKPEDAEKLFQPFSQVDAGSARQHEGTGLGLVLSKKLIEMHGGTICVKSEPGRGSVFSFTLPVSQPAAR
ncbi:MAG: PAS domain S-box protein [Elusimicrobiales bacterium]